MEELRALKAQHFEQLEAGESGKYCRFCCKHCCLVLTGSTHYLLKHLAPQGSAHTHKNIDACNQLTASSERQIALSLYNALKAKGQFKTCAAQNPTRSALPARTDKQ